MLFQEILILIPLTSLSTFNASDSNGISESEEPDPDGLVPPLAEVYKADEPSRRNCTTTLDTTTQTKITWCNDEVDTVDSSAVLGNYTVEDLQEELEDRHNVSRRLTKLEDTVVFEEAFYHDEEAIFAEDQQEEQQV